MKTPNEIKQTQTSEERLQTHMKYRELLSLSFSIKSLERKKPLILSPFITDKPYSVSANSLLEVETYFAYFVFL